jgi:hypothetical protein
MIFRKTDLYRLFYFDRFLPLFSFASWSLSFWVLLIMELFEEVATVAYVLYLIWNWTKGGSTILHTWMLLTRIVWSFVWRKFSSVGIGEWWDEMKYGQKLKLRDAHVTPRNIQEVQASKLGDAPRHPFFIDKYQVIFQDTIFILLRMLCVFLGASLFLLLVFFCFVCCNKWLDPNIFLLEKTHNVFNCLEHSSFHSYRPTSVLFF